MKDEVLRLKDTVTIFDRGQEYIGKKGCGVIFHRKTMSHNIG